MPRINCRDCGTTFTLDHLNIHDWMRRICSGCSKLHYVYVIRSFNDGRIVHARMISKPTTLAKIQGIEKKQTTVLANLENSFSHTEVSYGYLLYWSKEHGRNINCYYLQMSDSNSLIDACDMARRIQSAC